MKASEIKVGGKYIAKVGVNVTVVKVDSIGKREGSKYFRGTTTYSVTNLRSGRQTTFSSASKFRRVATQHEVDKASNITPCLKGWVPTQPRAVDTMKAATERVLANGHHFKMAAVVADCIKEKTLDKALVRFHALTSGNGTFAGTFNANEHKSLHDRVVRDWNAAATEEQKAIAAVELESQDEINRTNLVNGKVVVTPPTDNTVLRDILKSDPTRPTPRHGGTKTEKGVTPTGEIHFAGEGRHDSAAGLPVPKPAVPTFVVASLRRTGPGAFAELLYLVAAYQTRPVEWTTDPELASRFVGQESYHRAVEYTRDAAKYGLTCFIHCVAY